MKDNNPGAGSLIYCKIRRLILCCLVICSLITILPGCGKEPLQEDTSQNNGEAYPSHPGFITKQQLNTILAEKKEISSTPHAKVFLPQGRIVCAVVPHHLVAGCLIAGALEDLAGRQAPGLVVIVGPNHLNLGGKIITGYDGWQTPEGIVQTDHAAVRFMLENGLAVRDEEILAREHSVGALVPLIRHYLPGSRIVPVILHHDVGLQEIDKLLNGLSPLLDEKAVLISSVDFSHYLTRSEAQNKDRETLIYMKNYDYNTLFALGNDYLDSPSALAASLRLAEKLGIKEFTVLDNTNSGIILQNDAIPTTSYYTLMFTE